MYNINMVLIASFITSSKGTREHGGQRQGSDCLLPASNLRSCALDGFFFSYKIAINEKNNSYAFLLGVCENQMCTNLLGLSWQNTTEQVRWTAESDFLTVLEAGTSKIKVLAGLCPGLAFLPWPHVLSAPSRWLYLISLSAQISSS